MDNITLQAQQTSAIGAGTTLRYERVEDSRCPPDARCVWAGKISYHFSLTSPAGTQQFALDPGAPVFNPPHLPGVSIALVVAELPPVRLANAPAQASATPPVSLTITRP